MLVACRLAGLPALILGSAALARNSPMQIARRSLIAGHRKAVGAQRRSGQRLRPGPSLAPFWLLRRLRPVQRPAQDATERLGAAKTASGARDTVQTAKAAARPSSAVFRGNMAAFLIRRYICRSETPSISHASEISGSGARWAVMQFGFAASALKEDSLWVVAQRELWVKVAR
jgi:hypothetical protein